MSEASNVKPAHYRLSKATWDIIVDEYRHGATVPELSDKWQVSQHALRKRITVHGATKRDWGDHIAREKAKARDAAKASQKDAEKVRFNALFRENPKKSEESADTLSLIAMRASARAMRTQMWEEAKALAHLAEAYGRIATRYGRNVKRGEIRLQDIPLDLVKQIALNDDGCASELLTIRDQNDSHPAKAEYWDRTARSQAATRDYLLAAQQQGMADQKRIEELEEALVRMTARASGQASN